MVASGSGAGISARVGSGSNGAKIPARCFRRSGLATSPLLVSSPFDSQFNSRLSAALFTSFRRQTTCRYQTRLQIPAISSVSSSETTASSTHRIRQRKHDGERVESELLDRITHLHFRNYDYLKACASRKARDIDHGAERGLVHQPAQEVQAGLLGRAIRWEPY